MFNARERDAWRWFPHLRGWINRGGVEPEFLRPTGQHRAAPASPAPPGRSPQSSRPNLPPTPPNLHSDADHDTPPSPPKPCSPFWCQPREGTTRPLPHRPGSPPLALGPAPSFPVKPLPCGPRPAPTGGAPRPTGRPSGDHALRRLLSAGRGARGAVSGAGAQAWRQRRWAARPTPRRPPWPSSARTLRRPFWRRPSCCSPTRTTS